MSGSRWAGRPLTSPRKPESHDAAWPSGTDAGAKDGDDGLLDRSSAPNHRPSRLPVETADLIEQIRRTQKFGPARIAAALARQHGIVVPPATEAGLLQNAACSKVVLVTDSANSSAFEHTRFEKILVVVEKRLRLALEEARESAEHRGNKGSIVETQVRDVLRRYLPRHYGVGQGEIYDAYGDGTGQVDVIITNPDHPIAYPDDEVGPHLLDGVAAVGEVKSVLTTSELDKVIASATKFKRLRQTPQPGDRILNQSPEFTAETLGLPPYFLVVFDNRVAIGTLLERLRSAPLSPVPPGKAEPPQHPLDAVFILGKHVFLNHRSGLGPFLYTVPIKGWMSFPTQQPLSWLLAWLHKAMPRIERRESIVAPYLMPFGAHLAYMAARDAKEVFDVGDDSITSRE